MSHSKLGRRGCVFSFVLYVWAINMQILPICSKPSIEMFQGLYGTEWCQYEVHAVWLCPIDPFRFGFENISKGPSEWSQGKDPRSKETWKGTPPPQDVFAGEKKERNKVEEKEYCIINSQKIQSDKRKGGKEQYQEGIDAVIFHVLGFNSPWSHLNKATVINLSSSSNNNILSGTHAPDKLCLLDSFKEWQGIWWGEASSIFLLISP